MYLISSASLSQNFTAFSYSISGQFNGVKAEHSIEKNSTLIRGYLRSVVQGFHSLRGHFSVGGEIDVLIPDEAICKQFVDVGSLSLMKRLHTDNADLWQAVIDAKQNYKVRFMASPEGSPQLENLYSWQVANNPSALVPSLVMSPIEVHLHSRVV